MNHDVTHLDPAGAHEHTRACYWDIRRGRWRCPARVGGVGATAR